MLTRSSATFDSSRSLSRRHAPRGGEDTPDAERAQTACLLAAAGAASSRSCAWSPKQRPAVDWRADKCDRARDAQSVLSRTRRWVCPWRWHRGSPPSIYSCSPPALPCGRGSGGWLCVGWCQPWHAERSGLAAVRAHRSRWGHHKRPLTRHVPPDRVSAPRRGMAYGHAAMESNHAWVWTTRLESSHASVWTGWPPHRSDLRG